MSIRKLCSFVLNSFFGSSLQETGKSFTIAPTLEKAFFWSFRHCLHRPGFICYSITFDAVKPFVYTAPIETGIKTGSFWKRSFYVEIARCRWASTISIDIFGVCEKFQYVGWHNFVLNVIHKATYGFEKEKVNKQNIRFTKLWPWSWFNCSYFDWQNCLKS